jgi:transcriptional regulator with XRE-family HTH domain
MTVKEVVETICARNGMTFTEFAETAGVSKKTVSCTLSRNDGMGMKVETLIRWLDELSYQVIIQSPEDEDDLILDGE